MATPSGELNIDGVAWAAMRYADQLRLPDDRNGLITLDADARVVLPLTGDRGALAPALCTTELGETTGFD